jgi:RNA polymerase sigma-70 factor (ECF subfamily)
MDEPVTAHGWQAKVTSLAPTRTRFSFPMSVQDAIPGRDMSPAEDNREPTPSVRGGVPLFTTTRWSLIVGAREGGGDRGAAALAKLCQVYWYPLYAFLRRKGHGPADAEDLTQGFFAHLLARDFLKGLGREHGRFRSFLLVSLRNFLSDQRDTQRALKRGGGLVPLSLDALAPEERYALEPADPADAELAYERRWALTVLEQAMTRLRDEFAQAGRAGLFEALSRSLDREPDAGTGAEVSARLGMPENTFKSHLLRFRRRYRELICEEVAHTVATPADVGDELRHLKAILAG